jgi:hypothetical protein
VCCVAEAAGDGGGLVGVTSERDRFTTFFVPPPQDCRVQRYGRVHLERPAGLSGGPQRVAELLFERRGVEWAGLRRLGADRVVDMGQDGEHFAFGDETDDFSQVLANDLSCRSVPVEARRL